MLNESRYLQSFFTQQNAQIKKEIREMDLFCQQFNCEKQRHDQRLNEEKQVNFLIVGPQNSGKLSLMKTMHYALNNHKTMESESIEISNAVIKRYSIKQSKKLRIQGLQSMKQTSQKLTISGFVVQEKLYCHKRKPWQKLSKKQRISKFNEKYSTILNLIHVQDIGCNAGNSFAINKLCNGFNFIDKNNGAILSTLNRVKVVLITFNILQQVQNEQLTSLKFFIGDLKQKGLKVLVILTHIDRLNHLKEIQRLNFIEQKINNLKRQLKIEDRENFICLQSYKQFEKNQNKQQNKIFSNDFDFITPTKHYQNQNRNRIFCEGRIDSHKNLRNQSEILIEVPQIKNRFDTNISSKYNFVNKQNLNTSLVKILSKKHQKSAQKQNCIADFMINKVNSSKYLSNPFQISSFCNVNKNERYTIRKPKIVQTLNSNNQEINFYSLKLLMKIIKQTFKVQKPIKKTNTFLKWFCG